MNPLPQADSELEQRASSSLLDVLIRASLIGVLAVLCYQVFSPFLTLMVWSIILAVTLYPLHQWLAHKVGGKQWLASTILVIVGLLLIITPMALLMNSFADSVRHFIGAVQQNTLAIPAPREGVEKWPLVGIVLIRLFQQATICSVRAWRVLRFRRICVNSSVSSPVRRPVRPTWQRVAGRTGSRVPGAGTRAAIA